MSSKNRCSSDRRVMSGCGMSCIDDINYSDKDDIYNDYDRDVRSIPNNITPSQRIISKPTESSVENMIDLLDDIIEIENPSNYDYWNKSPIRGDGGTIYTPLNLSIKELLSVIRNFNDNVVRDDKVSMFCSTGLYTFAGCIQTIRIKFCYRGVVINANRYMNGSSYYDGIEQDNLFINSVKNVNHTCGEIHDDDDTCSCDCLVCSSGECRNDRMLNSDDENYYDVYYSSRCKNCRNNYYDTLIYGMEISLIDDDTSLSFGCSSEDSNRIIIVEPLGAPTDVYINSSPCVMYPPLGYTKSGGKKFFTVHDLLEELTMVHNHVIDEYMSIS